MLRMSNSLTVDRQRGREPSPSQAAQGKHQVGWDALSGGSHWVTPWIRTFSEQLKDFIKVSNDCKIGRLINCGLIKIAVRGREKSIGMATMKH